ncbi:MAG: trehalose-phosphatase [Candidatus Bathyarchaeia archaeon]
MKREDYDRHDRSACLSCVKGAPVDFHNGDKMKSLATTWTRLQRRLIAAPSVYVFFDLDGTLAAIRKNPRSVRLSKVSIALLERLAKLEKFHVSVISGRSIDDLKHLVPVKNIYLAGNHGFEIRGPNFSFIHEKTVIFTSAVKHFCKEASSLTKAFPGLRIENKEITASIHLRVLRPKNRVLASKKLKEIAKRFKNLIAKEGKSVIDIMPAIDWNKGRACRFLMSSFGSGLPIYFGDDRTDEDAFASLEQGITVLVSRVPIPSRANFYVRGIREVHSHMRRLLELYKSPT